MSNPFVSKLTPKNPLPQNETMSEYLPADGKMRPERGTAVLDRADPTAYDRSRRGLTPPVYEHPNVAYDEE